ncbi:MAG: hypothetical protein ACRD0C_22125, partial [Acidimicrobiia bacterium]
ADTVLYEGYLLYPYRASNGKNLTRVRWQFGVLIPRLQSETDPSAAAAPSTVSGAGETWYTATECIVDPSGDPGETSLDVRLRFLRLQSRVVEDGAAGGLQTGDEGTETELDVSLSLADLCAGEQVVPFELPATEESDGGVVRRRQALSLRLRASAEMLPGAYGIARVRLVVENVTDWAQAGVTRDLVLARAAVATHVVVALTGARFVSLVDPPEWAKPAVAGCTNEHTWPVLVGSPAQDTLLSAPMVLPDFPEIAPESPNELFDGLENDEILSLRIQTLTDAEKAEARATDPRAAAIIDAVDNLPPELYERLHGAIRSLEEVAKPANGPVPADDFPEIWTDEQGGVKKSTVPGAEEGVPWWNPAADASVDPDTDTVPIKGFEVGRGSRVVLRPGMVRSDAQDMFLVDREATVAAVLFDVDDEPYLAVVLDDDPGADIMRWHGRYLYFKPWEVEPVA